MATLAPIDPAIPGSGAYTVIVGGKNNSTGIGLVEVYDLGTASLDISSESHLANISTRGKVQTDDNVMIGGLSSRAATPQYPGARHWTGAGAQGVDRALQDTTLELHDGSGNLLTSNDDWQSDQRQQIIDTGAPPTDPRESAIVATLNPGTTPRSCAARITPPASPLSKLMCCREAEQQGAHCLPPVCGRLRVLVSAPAETDSASRGEDRVASEEKVRADGGVILAPAFPWMFASLVPAAVVQRSYLRKVFRELRLSLPVNGW